MIEALKGVLPDSINTDEADGEEDDEFGETENDEDGLHSTVLVVSTRDSFTLKQDVCMCCGSFGKGREGYLISCVQCGQCFHPYCVNVKVSCFFPLISPSSRINISITPMMSLYKESCLIIICMITF